jgi:hypothetical protein
MIPRGLGRCWMGWDRYAFRISVSFADKAPFRCACSKVSIKEVCIEAALVYRKQWLTATYIPCVPTEHVYSLRTDRVTPVRQDMKS